MRYAITTEPSAEPIELEDVKVFLRTVNGDTSEDEAVIIPLITTAREYCEMRTGRSIAEQTVTAYPTEFRERMYLPRPPLVSVESITYWDADGAEHTMPNTDYFVSSVDNQLIFNNIPNVRLRKADPISIVYKTGYATIPKTLRQAMLMLITHWYDNREAVSMGSRYNIVEVGMVPQLLNQFKVWWF